MPAEQRGVAPSCTVCGHDVELCAFCEKDDCRQPICHRCLRIELKQSMAHPHVHGG